MDLALGHMAAMRRDEVLDGVFQRDNVVAAIAIDLLDQSGKRRGLPAADRAGDEDESIVVLGQLLEVLRQSEVIHRADTGGHDPADNFDSQALPDDAGPKPAERRRVGKIHVTLFSQSRQLRFVQKAVRESFRVFGGEQRRVPEHRLQDTVAPPERGSVYRQVNVGRATLLCVDQVRVNVGLRHHSHGHRDSGTIRRGGNRLRHRH